MASALVGGMNISTGSAWIQGVDFSNSTLHPLLELAEKCGGLEGFFQKFDSETIYDSQGSTHFTGNKRLRYDDYDGAYENAQELVLRLQKGQGCNSTSVRYGLTQGGWTPVTPEDNWIEWYNHDFCFGEPPESSSLCEAVVNSNITLTKFLSSSASESAEYYVTDREGHEKLITCLARDVLSQRDNELHLNATITEINWSSEDCICVQANENGQDNQYCARYAVSTVSVGVLYNLCQPYLTRKHK